MTIGVWQPSDSNHINLQKVKEVVEIAKSVDLLDLKNALPQAFIVSENGFMKKQLDDWACLHDLENSELVNLVRFFTLAEMQLTGWEGGDLSPVIYIVKILRKRDAFEPELRKWIKANTDNRYLPNGAIL